MRNTVWIIATTLVALIAMDVVVASTLGWAERTGRLGALVRYFDYGRSVPGKLERWEARPGTRGNLYDVAWIDAAIQASAEKFNAEEQTAARQAPVVRAYGMSFVNNILEEARRTDPDLRIDLHAGPAAPPNYAYTLFEEDAANRHPGDIVVLGILSSSVTGMAALSNRSWVFEQPAPFTYPIYLPRGDGLVRIDPLVTSASMQRALGNDPALARAWAAQLAGADHFYSPIQFSLTWLDASPFARLVRRSLAIGHVNKTEHRILSTRSYPYGEVLNRMIVSFAQSARAQNLHPVVFLIQSGAPGDPNLKAITRDTLMAHQISYLATSDYVDPRDRSAFLGDGHYWPEKDAVFARAFLALVKGYR